MAGPATKNVEAVWQGRTMVFRGDTPGRPAIVIDGETAEGPSPMDLLLLALATCTGSDVVHVMRKKRVDMRELRVAVRGERREDYPRRYVKVDLVYHVVAPGATEQAVRQAIELSLEKYCSVTATLDPELPVGYALDLRA